jgi:hypothetical protein
MTTLRLLLAALAFAGLSACSTNEANKALANEQLRLALPGLWGLSDDNGLTFWAYDEYLPNGTVTRTGTVPKTRAQIRFVSAWTVSGSTVCTRVTETSVPQQVPVGLQSCDDVLHIDDKVMRIRSELGPEVKTVYRLRQKPPPDAAGRKPG